MENFEILDNYTKVPNEVFIIVKFMKPSSYIVLTHIVRKTIGFNKGSDGISISQFVEATGLSKRQVINSIAELKKLKVINITRQTQKNGGKSYNRYKLNLKGITTLVQNLHKGGADNAQGVVQNLHKGSADNAHTKENNTKNNLTKEEREGASAKTNDFIYLKFSDSLRAKKTDEYINHLLVTTSYVKSNTAFKITVKKKLAKGDKEQLQDFEEWFLNKECDILLKKYKGTKLIKGFSGIMEIEDIYPYFLTDGYNKEHKIYMKIIGQQEDSEIIGFNTNTELEEFIKENEY